MDAPAIRVLRRGGGDRPPVLLLHGLTGCAEAWGEGILAGLSSRAPILAVDLPGHGESRLSHDPRDHTFEAVLGELVALLDREGVEAADWVGYSMGGRLALGAAVLYPRRVRRLVLESASPGLAEAGARARRRREDEVRARRLEAGGIVPFVDAWMAQPLFQSQLSLPAGILRDARRRRLRNDPLALAASLRGLGTGSQPSLWGRLTTVEAETLLVTGALDGKYAELARRMGEALPRARHVVVPGAGHTVHLEAPRPWLEAVVPFLGADDGREGSADGGDGAVRARR